MNANNQRRKSDDDEFNFGRPGFHKIGAINNGNYDQGVGARSAAEIMEQRNQSLIQASRMLSETNNKLTAALKANSLLELENCRLRREISELREQQSKK